MSLRREPFETKDGRRYTLWADIDDVMSTIMPAYWSDNRDRRRKRGWMFRGQANSQWDMIPSLYRPPLDETVFKARQDYTEAFVDALRKESRRFGLNHLTDSEYLAVAQHYGFYTSLLDFSWNAETAAYFATQGGQRGQVGVIFSFNAKEYQEMRNPFAALGTTLEVSDAELKNAGIEPLPDLELIELYNVPRVYEQEGIFIHVTPEKMQTLHHECIDRFYFRQRGDKVHVGSFAHKAHWLPERQDFDSDESYEAFIELAHKERPDLFERTHTFGEATLFPPADPLSKFAEAWKHEHPDPTRRGASRVSVNVDQNSSSATRFATQVENYYYGDFPDSPYQSQYLLEGRQLVESLCEYRELDDHETQRWLLWELLKRNLTGDLKCTLKLGNAKTWGAEQDGFRFVVVDRWLADSYQITLSREQLQGRFWRVTFGPLSRRGRPEVTSREDTPFMPPASIQTPAPVNPHKGAHLIHVLDAVESQLAELDEAAVGSFLYDLHHVVMIAMGRNLELTAGLVESAPCLQRSPLVRPEHVDGPAILVRLCDHFTGSVSHTAVCAKHWDCMSEGDVDLMHARPWTLLGLA